MKVEEYLERMVEACKYGASEEGHMDADDILVEIVRELIKKRKDKDIWESVIGLYESTPKWYA